MLLNTAQGAPIAWTIGEVGSGRPADTHPGLLIRLGFGEDDRGRKGLVATVVLLRTSLAGETFLDPANILERFVDDRDWLVPELDGSTDKPKPLSVVMKELGAQRTSYFERAAAPITIGEAPAEAEVLVDPFSA